MASEIRLFGFTIKRPQESNAAVQQLPAVVPREQQESITTINNAVGGGFSFVFNLDGSTKDETENIYRYRDMALSPECDRAIQSIVTESICHDEDGKVVHLELDNVMIPQKIKSIIKQEFNNILVMLNFDDTAADLFYRWYVDGRLYFQTVIDPENTLAGIQELRYIDAVKLRKVKEEFEVPTNDPGLVTQGVKALKNSYEYYVYNEAGFNQDRIKGVKITKDSIAYTTSGVKDRNHRSILSYLHKAIRPYNQLRYMEDAAIIYRITRAPERRIFTVDVGDMPKQKAEQYIRDVMSTNKSTLQYDATTGTVREQTKFLTMMQDYYLPTRGGERGIKIDTLPSGDNLGEMDDIEYFKQKLFQSLNVPLSRLDSNALFDNGIQAQITNEEVLFHKFINKLRKRFAMLFTNLLEKQLILKNIMSEPDWEMIKHGIKFRFHDDSHFEEFLSLQNLTTKVNVLQQVDPYVGVYFSKNYVFKNILGMDDEEIIDNQEELSQEIASGDPTVTNNMLTTQVEIAQKQALMMDPLGEKADKTPSTDK